MVLIEWFLVYSENVCIHKRNANTFYAGVTFIFILVYSVQITIIGLIVLHLLV